MKLINFKKIGTVLAIAVFGAVSFTAGVDLTNKANSATSASVLPIGKGGTGGNTATTAAANILGTNFANYAGILPLEKGGLGVNASPAAGKDTARDNLNIPWSYTYKPGGYGSTTAYLKVASLITDRTEVDFESLVVSITSSSDFGNTPIVFQLLLNGRNWGASRYIEYGTACSKRAIYITEQYNEQYKKTQRDFYFPVFNWTQNVTVEYTIANQNVVRFTPQTLTTVPANSSIWNPSCYVTSPAPSAPPVPPTPIPSPTQ
jgi:hypothetical protein